MARASTLHKDLRLGRLVLLNLEDIRPKRWMCQCDCGNQKSVAANKLSSGNTKSCGCLRSEMGAKSMRKLAEERKVSGEQWTTHGKSKEPTYSVWSGMLNRCRNPNSPKFYSHGGRGITVCDKWLEFEEFYADMGDKPEGCSLDRIDNSKGYCKENCRWATPKQQARNTRANKILTWNDEKLCVAEWAEKLNMSPKLIYQRMANGWSVGRTLSTKHDARGDYSPNRTGRPKNSKPVNL